MSTTPEKTESRQNSHITLYAISSAALVIGGFTLITIAFPHLMPVTIPLIAQQVGGVVSTLGGFGVLAFGLAKRIGGIFKDKKKEKKVAPEPKHEQKTEVVINTGDAKEIEQLRTEKQALEAKFAATEKLLENARASARAAETRAADAEARIARRDERLKQRCNGLYEEFIQTRDSVTTILDSIPREPTEQDMKEAIIPSIFHYDELSKKSNEIFKSDGIKRKGDDKTNHWREIVAEASREVVAQEKNIAALSPAADNPNENWPAREDKLSECIAKYTLAAKKLLASFIRCVQSKDKQLPKTLISDTATALTKDLAKSRTKTGTTPAKRDALLACSVLHSPPSKPPSTATRNSPIPCKLDH